MRVRPWTSLLAVLLISFLVAWMASMVATPEDETVTFAVSFPLTQTVLTTEISFEGHGEKTFAIDVPMHNITNVDVEVRSVGTPEDPSGTGEIMAEIRPRAPDDAAKSGSGVVYYCQSTDIFGNCQDEGTPVAVAIDDWTHGRVPDKTTIDALDRQEAEREVARVYDETSWTGMWHGKIRVDGEVQFDRIFIEMTLRVTHYEASFEDA